VGCLAVLAFLLLLVFCVFYFLRRLCSSGLQITVPAAAVLPVFFSRFNTRSAGFAATALTFHFISTWSHGTSNQLVTTAQCRVLAAGDDQGFFPDHRLQLHRHVHDQLARRRLLCVEGQNRSPID